MLSKFFIDHPRFAIVISILFLLAGGIAMATLPVAQYPEITPSQVTVTCNYPGADAKTLTDTVIQPIETNINGVKKMLYFNSTATDSGSAVINVIFDIGTNGDDNTVNTQNRVNWATAALPEEVQKQGVITKEKSPNMLLVISITAGDGSLDSMTLSNFMSIYMKDRLARIPGVGDVVLFGEKKFSMRIWLDPNKMTAMKLNVSDIVSALQSQNVQVSAGAIGEAPAPSGQQYRIAVSTQGRLQTEEDFRNIVLKAKPDGSHVTLGSVATVELGAENYSSSCRSDGKPSASLAIYQLSDANGLEIAQKVIREVEEMKRTVFPPQMEYCIQYDSTRFITASIDEVKQTLFEAVLLVILVTFIFLQDWRSTLVPTIAIPVSLIGTFAVMWPLGYTINLITLFGLILAIGIVVDDAIVVIENVNRLIEEEGLSPRDAAIKSMEQVTGPVIATTAVLLAMFVPVCFLPGITGVMYRQFGVTISVSVLISSINALTLSPALSALILRPKETAEEKKKKFILFRLFDRFFELFNKAFDRFTVTYSTLVRSLVRKAFLVLLVTGGLLLVSGGIFKALPTGFVPEEDQGTIMVNVQLPDAASLNRTEAVMDKIESRLKGIKELEHSMSVAGYNIMTGVSASNCGFLLITLKDWSERPGRSQNDIMREFAALTSDISEAVIMPFGMPSIPGIGTTGGFTFVVQDPANTLTPAEFQDVVNDLITEANNYRDEKGNPVIRNAFTTFRATFPQIYLEVNRDKALKMGVSLADINTQLKGHFGYIYVNDFNKFGKSYKVEVQAKQQYRKALEDISTVKIRNNKGDMVPLSTLVTVQRKFVPQYLQRFNMSSSVTINGSPAPGCSSGQAMALMERLASEKLPHGMTFAWSDMSYQEKLSGNQIYIIFALALIFIYLFLVAQYESFMIPIAVLLSVPVALFGAVLSLLLLHIENNIYAQIGFVILFGIACKTAILIVEFAKEEHDKGVSIPEAAENAAKLRFRAVLMTAISFILGTLPLVIASGACSVSRRSLGTAVFGGMLVSVILGTLFIPAFYAAVQKVTEFFNRKRAK